MISKNYEEMDPDNQGRSQDYYLGVADASRYALDCLDLAFHGHGGIEAMSPRVRAVRDSVERLLLDMLERRTLWFIDHVGAKYDPAAQVKDEGEGTRPEEGSGAEGEAME